MRAKRAVLLSVLCFCVHAFADDPANNTADVDQELRALLWEQPADVKSAVTQLFKGVDVNNAAGVTLLMLAGATGDTTAIKYLIEDSGAYHDAVGIVGQPGFTLPEPEAGTPDPMKNLKDILGSNYQSYLGEFLYKRVQNGIYICAETKNRYTVVTYIVVGGYADILDYIFKQILTLQNGVEKLSRLINYQDNTGWATILYAASYKHKDDETEKEKEQRLRIFENLINNGANTQLTGKFNGSKELDLLGISSQYGHVGIVRYIKDSYFDLLKKGKIWVIEAKFGTRDNIETSITEASDVTEDPEILAELSAWEKTLPPKKGTLNLRR
ncbi:MAG: hypothetical protein V1647_01935 [Pseudomonadota bacterium]